MKKIEFFRHNIGEAEISKVNEVLRSLFLTTGSVVAELELKLAEYLDVEYTIALNSCTAALHLALESYNIGEGDEVITTPLSFVATANSILMARAMPVFVDVEAETGNIDIRQIEKAITEHTKAIMIVHLYGQMCDMRALRKLADKYNLIIIEDAAHCIEGERDGIRPGQLGDFACFSFYATKNIASGEGGAISVHTKEMRDKIKSLHTHGMTKVAAERYTKHFQLYDVTLLGWKYNMDNIHAALLLPQLEYIDKLWERRKSIYQYYEKTLKNMPYVIGTPQIIIENNKSAYHLFTFWLEAEKRDEFLNKLQAEYNIGVSLHFHPIHLFKYYRERFGYKGGEFPNAEHIGASTVTLPLYPKLNDDELEEIVKRVGNCLESL